MSENKNNRPKEIRSLKGPRRKLILEVHDGKRYIKKRDLQHYFFDEMWKIKDFQYHFGLGHRIVRSSLYKWFSKEDIDKSHRAKIAKKQLGDNNSNHLNWYRPSKLIPLSDLENNIKSLNNKMDLKKALDLTSYELSFIQQYYNIRLPVKDKLIDVFARGLSKNDINLLVRCIIASGNTKNFLSKDPKKITKGIENLVYLQWELRYLNRKIRKYYRKELKVNHISLPSNLTEYLFLKAFKKFKIHVIPQYFIKELNIHVDFYLPDYNVIVETDGKFHDENSDSNRDRLLKSLGYTKVIRIDIADKKVYRRYNTYKNIKLCLKNSVLNQLNR